LETGQFLSRDPAGLVDGPNLYTYVLQNPWTAFDPLGLNVTFGISSWFFDWVVPDPVGGYQDAQRQADIAFDPEVSGMERASGALIGVGLGMSVVLDCIPGAGNVKRAGVKMVIREVAEETGEHVLERGAKEVAEQTSRATQSQVASRIDEGVENSSRAAANAVDDKAAGAADGSIKFKRWSRGEAIDKPMPDGSDPSWNVVRSRYWKNRSEAASPGEFSQANLERMKRGSAPQDFNSRTGQWESRELHHVDPQRNGGSNGPFNLRELTPEQHRALDRHRK
jgi:uncharacterized protein RhaS with RHS repeats